jgi:hypothetical protein
MGQERESLRDLDGVSIDVEEITPIAKASGLSRESLRQLIEATLVAARIRVLRMGEFQTGDPYLRVRVATTMESRGTVAFLVQVDFVQIVFMRRNPAVTFNRAETWSAAPGLGMAQPAQLAPAVRRVVLDGINEFVKDFQATNKP